METKYLIIGQGLAGTLIAFECYQRGIPFLVLDEPSLSIASKIAAGIINPITGRKFVKSWNYETFHPQFIKTYREFSDLLGKEYLHEKEIIRAIPSIADLNTWDARCLESEAAPYMDSKVDFSDFENKVHEKSSYGKVNGYQLKIASLISDFRSWLVKKDLIIEGVFEHKKLISKGNKIAYKNLIAEAVIFCEGHKVEDNPYFKNLPWVPAKGELLLIKAPDLKTEKLLKDQLFVVPVENDLYWVGASYAWEDFYDKGSAEKKKWLVQALDKILDIPYEIVEHLAGVRPATNDRKPLIGHHPVQKNLFLFNGLGAKGSSLGPYFAKMMVDYITEGKEIDRIVNINWQFSS